MPHDDHGNPDYIIIEDLEKAASIDNIRLDQALKNLIATVQIARKETGHRHQ
jgi:hypothetical protein